MSDYTEHTLHSGKIVNLRPLTWEEYWSLGDQRLDVINFIPADQHNIAQRKEFLQKTRELRQSPLEWCVENWEEIKATINMAEVLEIEKIINSMSELPILEGNSSPAAAITATEIKPSIAEPA